MATKYNVPTFIQGVNGFGLQPCLDIYNVTLAASTAVSVTVPGGAADGTIAATTYNKFVAVFSYTSGASVWVAVNKTAAVPAGATFAAATSVMNPEALIVKRDDTISVISTGTPGVAVAFYAIQE